MNERIKIGTRGSPLALAQAREVETYLFAAHPHLIGHTEIVEIETTGDAITDRSLVEIGGKSLFTKEIEIALLNKEVDIAVHSMKDVPTEIPQGLEIGAILPREDPRDVLLTRDNVSLEELQKGAIFGTASLRRAVQIKNKYPELEIVNFRGNVGTRLRKLESGEVDATMLAAAGLNRLGMGYLLNNILDIEDFIPAVAQGAVGVQCRTGDKHIKAFLPAINDPDTEICVIAERAFMKKLDGSCRTPLGAIAEVKGKVLRISGFKSDVDGGNFKNGMLEGTRDEAYKLGERLAEMLLQSK